MKEDPFVPVRQTCCFRMALERFCGFQTPKDMEANAVQEALAALPLAPLAPSAPPAPWFLLTPGEPALTQWFWGGHEF